MRSPALSLLARRAFFLGLLLGVDAQSQGELTPQQQVATISMGITRAKDGSTILDTAVPINGLQIRFRVRGPAAMFTTTSGVVGGTQAPGSTGSMGLNVLLHGDGGKSFIAFPNQIVQDGLMGVVVLAPSEQLLWGQHKGPPGGLSRPDGVVDAQAVRDLVAEVLPHYVAFDPQHVFFTGVSGGSLLLSGFFMPAHMADFGGPGSGVLLLCGGMQPQVPVAGATAWAASTRIHHQSSQRELSLLQPSIPQAVRAYEALARQQGLNATAVGALQTVDNTPAGGHCVFDGITYNSGIQLFMDHFADVMQGGNGSVPGIDTPSVLKTVVGNEDLRFAGATKSRQSVSFEA